MPNGFEAFARNAIELGDTWRERRRQRKMAEAMTKFDEDPAAALAGVTKVDAITGWNMRRQIQSDAAAAEESKRARTTENLKTVIGLLQPTAMDPNRTPESLAGAYDSVIPLLSDGLGMKPEEIAKWKTMFMANPAILNDLENQIKPQVVAPGSVMVGPGPGGTARELYRNPYPDQVMQVVRGDGGRDVIQVPRTYGGSSQSIPGGGGGGGGDLDSSWAFTLKHEGGYNPSDANGKPVKYGINQGANPDVDVKNLTPEAAKRLYTERYWNPSGAANLPGPLATVHADTYYINPQRAQEFLQQSGGDPQRYLQIRQAWHDRLVANNPKKFGRYAKAWTSRVNALAQLVGGGGGAAPAQRGGTGAVYTTPGKPASGPGASGGILSHEEVAELGLTPNVRWQRGKNGLVVPVGGVANMAKLQKQDQIYESITANTNRMESAAKSLLNHPGLQRAAGANSYFPSIRGGNAADFERQLDALKSQIGFAILNDMRQMSPTGGALGNVSNFEVETLQRNIAALDVSQSPAQLRSNIKQIMDYARGLRTRYSRAYKLDRSKTGTPKPSGGQAAPPRAAIDMLRSNPSPARKQQFDEIFGPGASDRVLGGGGGGAPRNNFSELMPIGQTTPYGTRL